MLAKSNVNVMGSVLKKHSSLRHTSVWEIIGGCHVINSSKVITQTGLFNSFSISQQKIALQEVTHDTSVCVCGDLTNILCFKHQTVKVAT